MASKCQYKVKLRKKVKERASCAGAFEYTVGVTQIGRPDSRPCEGLNGPAHNAFVVSESE